MKNCPHCGLDLSAAEFSIAMGDKPHSWCTNCVRYVLPVGPPPPVPELPVLVDVTDEFGCYASLRSASEVKRNGWPRVGY